MRGTLADTGWMEADEPWWQPRTAVGARIKAGAACAEGGAACAPGDDGAGTAGSGNSFQHHAAEK